MFSNYKNENILGKSKCGCSNTSPINVPSSSMKLEFVPVYNPSGSQHYIPLLDKKKKSVSFIPNEIIDRQKKGFNSPFNEWLFEEYKDKLLFDIKKVNNFTSFFIDEYVQYIYENAKSNKLKQHFYALWHFCIWYDKNYL